MSTEAKKLVDYMEKECKDIRNFSDRQFVVYGGKTISRTIREIAEKAIGNALAHLRQTLKDPYEIVGCGSANIVLRITGRLFRIRYMLTGEEIINESRAGFKVYSTCSPTEYGILTPKAMFADSTKYERGYLYWELREVDKYPICFTINQCKDLLARVLRISEKGLAFMDNVCIYDNVGLYHNELVLIDFDCTTEELLAKSIGAIIEKMKPYTEQQLIGILRKYCNMQREDKRQTKEAKFAMFALIFRKQPFSAKNIMLFKFNQLLYKQLHNIRSQYDSWDMPDEMLTAIVQNPFGFGGLHYQPRPSGDPWEIINFIRDGADLTSPAISETFVNESQEQNNGVSERHIYEFVKRYRTDCPRVENMSVATDTNNFLYKHRGHLIYVYFSDKLEKWDSNGCWQHTTNNCNLFAGITAIIRPYLSRQETKTLLERLDDTRGSESAKRLAAISKHFFGRGEEYFEYPSVNMSPQLLTRRIIRRSPVAQPAPQPTPQPTSKN